MSKNKKVTKLKRVYTLAKELKVPSRIIVNIIKDMLECKAHASGAVNKKEQAIIKKAIKSGKYNEPEKKNGRPKWTPSVKELNIIERMAGLGLIQEEIADILGICRTTLNRHVNDQASPVFKHYRVGKAKTKYRIFESGYRMAEHNPRMNIFLQRSVYGRRENDSAAGVDHEEHAAKVRKAIAMAVLPEPED